MSARLDAQTYAFLAGYGAAVRNAPDAMARRLACEVAVRTARRYHDDGVSWAEIAKALGIQIATLRDWRGGASASKPAAPVSTVEALTTISTEAGTGAPRTQRIALIALGAASANGNDFPAEAAAIRRMLRPHGIHVAERCAVELGELKQELDALRPAALHLAAHLQYGLVYLSAEDGKPSATSVHDVCDAIRTSEQPPRLVVFNGCDTAHACHMLTQLNEARGLPVASAIGWCGTLEDSRGRFFAQRFYAQLAGGDQVGRSFESPRLTITARWPDRTKPVLYGNALVSPFLKV
jgi:transposase-like protein